MDPMRQLLHRGFGAIKDVYIRPLHPAPISMIPNLNDPVRFFFVVRCVLRAMGAAQPEN